MFAIDDWLLRRVFQPVVDWLSPRCSRFCAARWCAQIAIIALIGSPLYSARIHAWATCGLVLFANGAVAIVWFKFITRWRMQERQEARGHIRHTFYIDALLRLVYLILVITMVALATFPIVAVGPCAQAFAFIAITCGIYLADCNPGTPRRRRVMQWAHA